MPEQLEMSEVGRDIFESAGLVLDQLDARRQDAGRTEQAQAELPRGAHANPMLEPVDRAAQGAVRHGLVQVGFIEEAVEGEQLDQARIRGQ